jgi:hypothetical protein
MSLLETRRTASLPNDRVPLPFISFGPFLDLPSNPNQG